MMRARVHHDTASSTQAMHGLGWRRGHLLWMGFGRLGSSGPKINCGLGATAGILHFQSRDFLVCNEGVMIRNVTTS
jgi:hypothetical protein